MPDFENNSFKDPTGLTKWTRWLLYAQVIISVIALYGGGVEYRMLSCLQQGLYRSNAEALAAAHASYQFQGIIGITQVIIFLLFYIMYYQWLYRANYNVRRLGASEMEFTPGWSVGWYFIPFANLWKPYAAMKELWKASTNPQNWREQPSPSLLGWWWFFWVASNMLSTMSFKLSMRAHDVENLIVANVVTTISDALDILPAIIMITLVSRIYTMQMARYQEHLTEGSGTGNSETEMPNIEKETGTVIASGNGSDASIKG